MVGEKRRSAEHLDYKLLSYFVDACENAEHTRDSCLLALLYLSGRRISEVLELKTDDIAFTNDFLVITTFNEKAYTDHSTKTFTIFRDGRYYEQIDITISLTTEAYRDLGPFVETHLNTLKEGEYLFQHLNGGGHIKRSMAYKIIVFLAPDLWPHRLRHERFTQVYKIIKSEVKEPFAVVRAFHDFTKHKRLETSMNYVEKLELLELKKKI